MAVSSHSAAGQALGYVHQCLWALVEFGKRASDRPEIELRLEALDDVQFDEHGSPIELLQVKHHAGSAASISASSTDLWRTLNVWMDLPEDVGAVLRLVTTQVVATGDELLGLTSRSRNTEDALGRILQAARTSENKATQNWRERFLDLDSWQQQSLISRIVLEDRSPHAEDLSQSLAKVFRFGIPAGREDVFLELLIGRWAMLAVGMLSGKIVAVAGTDLIAMVSDITGQLGPDSLPIDPSFPYPFQPDDAAEYAERQFVAQLRWIALDETRLWKSIRDYHRAFAQRSYWLRHQLIPEAELDRFAARVRDEWENIFDKKCAQVMREGRTDLDIVGQEVLEDLSSQSRARVRDRFDEGWFSRGMFHALADGEIGLPDDPIGWHPDFVSKLGELLDAK